MIKKLYGLLVIGGGLCGIPTVAQTPPTPPATSQVVVEDMRATTDVGTRLHPRQRIQHFAKAYFELFPTDIVSYDRWVTFSLWIDEEGSATEIEVLRSDFRKEQDAALIQLIDRVTLNMWVPATVKGKAVERQHTLRIGIAGKGEE